MRFLHTSQGSISKIEVMVNIYQQNRGSDAPNNGYKKSGFWKLGMQPVDVFFNHGKSKPRYLFEKRGLPQKIPCNWPLAVFQMAFSHWNPACRTAVVAVGLGTPAIPSRMGLIIVIDALSTTLTEPRTISIDVASDGRLDTPKHHIVGCKSIYCMKYAFFVAFPQFSRLNPPFWLSSTYTIRLQSWQT